MKYSLFIRDFYSKNVVVDNTEVINMVLVIKDQARDKISCVLDMKQEIIHFIYASPMSRITEDTSKNINHYLL